VCEMLFGFSLLLHLLYGNITQTRNVSEYMLVLADA